MVERNGLPVGNPYSFTDVHPLVARPPTLTHSSRMGIFSVYCIVESGFEETGPCKLGITKDITKRIYSLQAGNWRELKLIWTVDFPSWQYARQAEEWLLSLFRPNCYDFKRRDRLKSEWVETNPNKALSKAEMYAEAIGK